MNKIIKFFVIVVMCIICSACTNQIEESTEIGKEETTNMEAVKETTKIENSNEVKTTSQVEEVMQTEEMNDLNLDGIGEFDDKIVVTSYSTGEDLTLSFSILEVYLGTGQQLTRRYEGDTTIYITLGDLFQVDYDQIMVQVAFNGSFYGASDTYVYQVVRDSETVRLEENVVLLEGGKKRDSRSMEDSVFYKYRDHLDISSVFRGEIIYINEVKSDGVYVEWYDKEKMPYSIFYWQDDKWKLFKDGDLTNDGDSMKEILEEREPIVSTCLIS